jgi:hypothetical protein
MPHTASDCASKSWACLRLRFNQAKVRSTVQRRGKTEAPVDRLERSTISIPPSCVGPVPLSACRRCDRHRRRHGATTGTGSGSRPVGEALPPDPEYRRQGRVLPPDNVAIATLGLLAGVKTAGGGPCRSRREIDGFARPCGLMQAKANAQWALTQSSAGGAWFLGAGRGVTQDVDPVGCLCSAHDGSATTKPLALGGTR